MSKYKEGDGVYFFENGILKSGRIYKCDNNIYIIRSYIVDHNILEYTPGLGPSYGGTAVYSSQLEEDIYESYDEAMKNQSKYSPLKNYNANAIKKELEYYNSTESTTNVYG